MILAVHVVNGQKRDHGARRLWILNFGVRPSAVHPVTLCLGSFFCGSFFQKKPINLRRVSQSMATSSCTTHFRPFRILFVHGDILSVIQRLVESRTNLGRAWTYTGYSVQVGLPAIRQQSTRTLCSLSAAISIPPHAGIHYGCPMWPAGRVP